MEVYIMQYQYKYHSPLGDITMASNGEAITGLWFDGQKYFGSNLSDDSVCQKLPIFLETCHWLDIYFQGQEPDFTPALSLSGTDFRVNVWNQLKKIPYGETTTYKQIAQAIARQQNLTHMSAQAIGGAVGHNPISIIIPCHRVLGSDKSLTGYAGGIDKKRALLTLEGTFSD